MSHTYKVLDNKKYSIEEFKIDDNIFIIKSDTHVVQAMKTHMLSDIDGLLITIYLNGSIEHKSHLSDFSLNIHKNMTSLNLFQKEEGVDIIEENTHIQNIHIIFKKEFLRRNFLDMNIYEKMINFFEKNENAKNIKTTKTSVQNQMIANEIFNSQYTGDLNKIFLHAKALEILFNEFNDLLMQSNTPKNIGSVKLSSYDIDAIHKAKELMIKNIQNPPSTAELSKIVKLNEFKLKIGFKNIFNTSPYKFAVKYKMLKAKELLQTSDMNVSEVSYAVGYKYTHNFSKVFSQTFGITPKSLMKSSTYYY